jgi:hypothetical protein
VKTKLLLAAAACAGALTVAACGSAPGPATTATSTSPSVPEPAGSPNPNYAIQSPKPTMSGTKVACDLVTGLSTQVKETLAHTHQTLSFVAAGEPVVGLYSCQYSYGSTPQTKVSHVIVAGVSCNPKVYVEYTQQQPKGTRETKTIYHLAPGIWEMTAGGNAIVQLTAMPPVPFSAVQAALQQMASILGSVGCPN